MAKLTKEGLETARRDDSTNDDQFQSSFSYMSSHK